MEGDKHQVILNLMPTCGKKKKKKRFIINNSKV